MYTKIMLITLSPAKTLDETPSPNGFECTTPEFLEHSVKLINKLNRMSHRKLRSLMNLSDNLVKLNKQRYSDFTTPFTQNNAKQNLIMFKGDVYEGLAVDDFSQDDFAFAQAHLRILSGLYGVLRPLDLIQPYRLEMGTRLSVGRRKNLYEFWTDPVTEHLNQTLLQQGDNILINLASNEYSKVVNTKKLKGTIVSPVFKEERDKSFIIISFFAKKARGLLARYIIKNRLATVTDIQNFDLEGYRFNPGLSTDHKPVFTRKSNTLASLK